MADINEEPLGTNASNGSGISRNTRLATEVERLRDQHLEDTRKLVAAGVEFERLRKKYEKDTGRQAKIVADQRAEVERLREGWDADVDWANKLLVERDEARAHASENAWNGAQWYAKVERLREALNEIRARTDKEYDDEMIEDVVTIVDRASDITPDK